MPSPSKARLLVGINAGNISNCATTVAIGSNCPACDAGYILTLDFKRCVKKTNSAGESMFANCDYTTIDNYD